jgi:cytoskeletal protein CcmA (bactofilin family)
VWIFQISKNLIASSGQSVVLRGHAQPQNIFWQVAGKVSLGTTSHFEGIVLSKTLIAMKTGASIDGRLFAQTAVTLQKNSVTAP